jgi:hypothetical protein
MAIQSISTKDEKGGRGRLYYEAEIERPHMRHYGNPILKGEIAGDDISKVAKTLARDHNSPLARVIRVALYSDPERTRKVHEHIPAMHRD